MRGQDVVDALKRKLKVNTDAELAGVLGRSATSIANWRSVESLSARQIANMVADSKRVARVEAAHDAIRPIVEFFPIEHTESAQGRAWELFDAREDEYRRELRAALEATRGVYIFYDSRGRALYAGKAADQSLWKEMKSAFNRRRNPKHQKIYRVEHHGCCFDAAVESRRQISTTFVPLSELAHYFTAYEVEAPMIPEVEALIVRSFANDLLNHRMERFSQQRTRS